MWLRKPGRETKRWLAAFGILAAVGAALAVSGCGAAYVEENTASVLLLIESIAEGTPQLSDVRGENGLIVNCQIELTLSARPKNPNGPVGISEDVQLNRYTVTYRRADGRSVEGIDVPFAISGNTSALVSSSGSSATQVFVDLVRHQAKLEPPLMNITGLQVVTMFADISVFGTSISGKSVSARGSAQVTFADFADGTTTCEG
jgi:hypothetical protein